MKNLPMCIGHEITGIVKRVGKNVHHLKIGDRAAIGNQCGSACNFTCEDCKQGHENTCQEGMIETYNDFWDRETKEYPTTGGYAEYWRGHSHFVVKVPDAMTNEQAAPYMCGGVTVYAPIKRHGVGPGSRVGVIGLGGLGHFAVQWTKALGGEAVVLSHSPSKKQDALDMGASDFVITSDKEAMQKMSRSLTHIVCTSFSTKFDWDFWFDMLKTNGKFILVGLPDERLSGIDAMLLAGRQISLIGSMVGSIQEINECLALAVDKGVKVWVERYDMKDAQKALDAMAAGKARYRIVMVNQAALKS